MAGVRYTNEFTSNAGIEYLVEIWDESFVGSSTPIQANGFDLIYTGENSERFENIKASELKIYLDIQTSAEENFINEIVGAAEQRFYIRAYRNSSLYWTGLVIQDLVNLDHTCLPFSVQLTATDGLNVLKNYPAVTSVNYGISGINRILSTIFATLKNTPLYKFINATDPFIKTSINWYNTEMFTGLAPGVDVDPLFKAAIQEVLFRDSENEPLKSYDILEICLKAFGLRIFQADGIWHIVNITEYENTQIRQRIWLKNESFSSSTLYNHRLTFDKQNHALLATPNKQFYPAVNKVSVIYNTTNKNLLSKPNNYGIYNYVGRVENIAGKKFRVTFTCYYSIDFDETVNFKVGTTFFIKCENGADTYYLKGAVSGTEYSSVWELNGPEAGVFRTYTVDSNESLGTFEITFDTADIPFNEGNIYIKVGGNSRARSILAIGIDFNPKPGSGAPTFDYSIKELSVELVDGDSEDVSEIFSDSENTATPINSVNLEVPVKIGDGPASGMPGSLWIYNQAETQLSPTNAEWKVNGTGTAYSLNKLLSKIILEGQARPIPKLQGSFFSNDYHFYRSINIDSATYVVNGAALNAKMDEWTGEWFEIKKFAVSITETANPKPGLPQLPRAAKKIIGGLRNVFETVQVGVYGHFEGQGITTITTGVTPGDTLTELTIVPSQLTVLKTNDKLRLYNPITAQQEEVTIAADVAATDDKITIVSKTFTFGFPETSYLYFSRNSKAGVTPLQLMQDIGDVKAVDPTNQSILLYNLTSEKWEAKAPSNTPFVVKNFPEFAVPYGDSTGDLVWATGGPYYDPTNKQFAINRTPVSSTAFSLNGNRSDSLGWTAQFHNSTGTSNTLVLRDDGDVFVGTNSNSFGITNTFTIGRNSLDLMPVNGINTILRIWPTNNTYNADIVLGSGLVNAWTIRTNANTNSFTLRAPNGGPFPLQILSDTRIQWSPTRTAIINNDFGYNITGTITARPGNPDTLNGVLINPNLVAGANNQILAALTLNATYTTGVFSGVNIINIYQTNTAQNYWLGHHLIDGAQTGFGYRLSRSGNTGSLAHNGTDLNLVSSTGIRFLTGAGVNAGFIDSSQNWFIGPFGISPTAKFHIRSSSFTSGNALVVENSTPAVLLQLANTGQFFLNTASGALAFTHNSDVTNMFFGISLGTGANQRSVLYCGDALSVLGNKTLVNQGNFVITNTRSPSQSLSNGTLFITRDGIETSNTANTETRILIIGHKPGESFAPTSGNVRWIAQLILGTINQTGTANGIVNTLLIKPTITSAPDFRAIEVSLNRTSANDHLIKLSNNTKDVFAVKGDDKIGFFNAAPVAQATNAIATLAFLANTSNIVDDSATWGGYTIGQIVNALKLIGIIA